MITPINNAKPSVQTSIFYLNDIHGNANKMEKVKTAANQFDAHNMLNSQVDALKLCAGDTLIGANDNKNNNAVDFLNTIKFDAMTLGNHEMDNPMSKAVKYYHKIQTPIVSSNLTIPQNHALKNEIVTSLITEKNGNKYGILGIQPFDISSSVTSKEWLEGVDALSKKETIKKIQKEVNKLEKQGVDKIILISHSGLKSERDIAQATEGIDVIIGGHSHDLMKGVEEGKNLLYSKRNEPVILTQAYKNGDYFGVLNVGFDNKGRIIEAQNNVTPTKKYSSDLLMAYFTNKNLGAPNVIGRVTNKVHLKSGGLLEENPYANIITDAMRSELDTDIAILNSANIRGGLPVGELTDRDISEITPFDNKMTKIRINQKELVDALKLSGNSFKHSDFKPGILQVSGLNYTMNKQGELLSADFIQKDGTKVPINIQNPDENTSYVVAIDNYYASGRENFSMLNKIDKAIAIYDYDKDKLAIDYIKRIKKPLEFKKDGRITIV